MVRLPQGKDGKRVSCLGGKKDVIEFNPGLPRECVIFLSAEKVKYKAAEQSVLS